MTTIPVRRIESKYMRNIICFLPLGLRFAVCAQIIAGEPKLEANYMIKNTKASRKKIQTPSLKRIVGATDREFKDTYFNGI
jgi:hypothetical protein